MYTFPNETTIGVPYFTPVPSETEAENIVLAELQTLSGTRFRSAPSVWSGSHRGCGVGVPLYEAHKPKYDLYYMLPTGMLDFQSLDVAAGLLNYSARVNDNNE